MLCTYVNVNGSTQTQKGVIKYLLIPTIVRIAAEGNKKSSIRTNSMKSQSLVINLNT